MPSGKLAGPTEKPLLCFFEDLISSSSRGRLVAIVANCGGGRSSSRARRVVLGAQSGVVGEIL